MFNSQKYRTTQHRFYCWCDIHLKEDTNILQLEPIDVLKNENVIKRLAVNKATRCFEVALNHAYSNNNVISRVYPDWTKTLHTFTIRAGNKGISNEHITMLTDTFDNNYGEILRFVYEEDEFRNGSNALGLVNEKVVELFLDETKTPYAAISLGNHIETIPKKYYSIRCSILCTNTIP